MADVRYAVRIENRRRDEVGVALGNRRRLGGSSRPRARRDGFRVSAAGVASTAGSVFGATARFFGVAFFADFFGNFAVVFLADFLAGFLATFFAAFFGDFFATFFAAFFEALPAFFDTRLLLAARFFAAAFLLALAGDLRTFFALRFFEAFFPAVATKNSF